jgi:hypothetical protein
MITSRIAAALAAGALAIGILAGSAGTIVLRDATSPSALDLTARMGSMMGGSGGMMGGSGFGSGGMMGGSGGTGPGTSAMPDYMQQHHVAASTAPIQ